MFRLKPFLRLLPKITEGYRTESTLGDPNVFTASKEHPALTLKLLSDAETSRFQSFLPQILQDIGCLRGMQSMPDTTEWLSETIQA
ncbi:unnamed protein product, partial [Allacma fusca]